MITPAFGITAVAVSWAIFAACSYRRFPPIAEDELQSMRKAPDVGPNPLIALGACAAWFGLIVFSVRTSPEWVTVLVWAGAPIAAVVWFYWRGARAQSCESCSLPTRTFRKKHRKSVPAIVYVHVCPRCNTYREELVIAITGD